MNPLQFSIVVAAVVSGMASGMMYVFSTGILQAFGQLPQAEAVRAMQAINVAVINPAFLGVFMGTGLFAVILSAWHLLARTGDVNPWLIAATVVYVLGVVFVTIGGNVPLNDALAPLDPTALPPGAWERYARPWFVWNNVRTVAAAAASALFIFAARS